MRYCQKTGKDDEKGTITGIARSLTALARAFGPTFSSIGTQPDIWKDKNNLIDF